MQDYIAASAPPFLQVPIRSRGANNGRDSGATAASGGTRGFAAVRSSKESAQGARWFESLDMGARPPGRQTGGSAARRSDRAPRGAVLFTDAPGSGRVSPRRRKRLARSGPQVHRCPCARRPRDREPGLLLSCLVGLRRSLVCSDLRPSGTYPIPRRNSQGSADVRTTLGSPPSANDGANDGALCVSGRRSGQDGGRSDREPHRGGRGLSHHRAVTPTPPSPTPQWQPAYGRSDVVRWIPLRSMD